MIFRIVRKSHRSYLPDCLKEQQDMPKAAIRHEESCAHIFYTRMVPKSLSKPDVISVSKPYDRETIGLVQEFQDFQELPATMRQYDHIGMVTGRYTSAYWTIEINTLEELEALYQETGCDLTIDFFKADHPNWAFPESGMLPTIEIVDEDD